jgi:arylformamidase
MIFLSYTLNSSTPSYGNRNPFLINKKSAIAQGDIANDSTITTTVHIGTHLDMPYHFYENGQTISAYDADFFSFSKILFLEITPENFVIKDELIRPLSLIEDRGYDILLVKTGACAHRTKESYWSHNHGFHPDVYTILIERFPSIRIFGFDTISVSSFQDRAMGREAHKRFLNPDHPVLLLEDMNLCEANASTVFTSLIIAPLRIEQCDGIPCTVMATVV